jgi:hypothetical protein
MVDILDRWLYNTAMMTNKTLADIAKGLALVLTLLGALATALQWDPGNIVLLNAGSLLYLYWSLTVRDWNLVAVNAGLLTIYVIGAIIRLL